LQAALTSACRHWQGLHGTRSGSSAAQAEEALWTELIDKYRGLDAPWAADVVGRALGNRGNSRVRQGRAEEALKDFDAAIALCPWAVDPVLNRGVALEGLERWDDAIRCSDGR